MLGAETSVQKAAMEWDDANLHIKGAEDWAALAEREALEWVSRVEADNSIALSSTSANIEDLARKVTLIEDKLVEERREREASKREHRECFEELALLQTRGSELCHAIISPPRARHLSEGMRLAALRHTEMAVELATFWEVVSSAMESVLGNLPSNAACAEMVADLAVEFQKVEGHCSKLERPTARIYDLLQGPPPSLDEAAGQNWRLCGLL
jgi:hypothetical protein